MKKTLIIILILAGITLAGTIQAGWLDDFLYNLFYEEQAEEDITLGVTPGVLPKWKSTSTDATGNTINAIEPRGNKDVYIDANASTTGSMDAAIFCISGANCITSWAEGAAGVPGSWHEIWSNTLAPTSTSAGFYSYASSTIHSNFRVDGNATTTGSHYIGQDLTVMNGYVGIGTAAPHWC
jgi:hypothetical protein